MLSLDFNSSLFSISFAYCSQFSIYFDKKKYLKSFFFRLGRGNKTKDKSMISLDFNNSLFSISFAYCSRFTIYSDEKRVFEIFFTIIDLAEETRLSLNV